jgi:pimeloyl-ACP methyl ester carboxylesterase
MRNAARRSLIGAMLLAAIAPASNRARAGEQETQGAAVRLPPVAGAGEILLEGEQPLVTAERLSRGYTIVVVGVNGDNMLSAGLAPGLVDGGYAGAVEVVDWTTGYWPLFIYHLRASGRHRDGAQVIAEKIAAYRARYPGREVNLVGYSAGAAVALDAVEKMAPELAVDRVVLLAGAVSPLRDLRTVLGRVRVGVWSYYQPQDVVALWAGTLVAGTADGQHTMSAGAVGFWRPPKLSDEERKLYRDKLVPLPYQAQMARSGNLGGHFQCVGRKFVAQWIAPLLSSHPRVGVAHDSRGHQR